MRTNHRPITETNLFRLAQALLPQAVLLVLFGPPVPVAAQRAAARLRSRR